MDFSTTDEQTAIRELAEQILGETVTPERLDGLDEDGTWFDGDLWQDLADAGLTGMAIPAEHGGQGLSFLELHFLLEQVGRTVAYVPVWETLVLGALPIARFGTAEQCEAVLPGVASGGLLLTAALSDDGRAPAPEPTTTAAPTDDGWHLTGRKGLVPIGGLADRVLVSAAVEDGPAALFLIDPGSDGVEVRPQETTVPTPHAELQLDVEVAGDAVLGDDVDTAAEALRWLVPRARAGLASLQAGVCDRAVTMAAEYTSEREQFDRPIASFQAVGQRVADAYIDAEAIRLTALQAAWRLSSGEPADDEVSIAKWWAADGGHRVVHAAQHVHGGVGVDLDYPLHRYFRNAKRIEFVLGSATDQLLELGASMAGTTP